jgi:fucose permease
MNADKIVMIFGVFVAIAIVLALGVTLLSNISDTQATNSIEQNATNKSMQLMTGFTDLMPAIGVLLVAILIIWLITLISKQRVH